MKTKQKWDEMSAAERDKLIAVSIFGWTPCRCGEPECGFAIPPGAGNDDDDAVAAHNYTTSLPAAFEVVEKMREDFAFKCETLGLKWKVIFDNETGYWSAADKSLPAAICLAALRAKGIEVRVKQKKGKE